MNRTNILRSLNGIASSAVSVPLRFNLKLRLHFGLNHRGKEDAEKFVAAFS